MDNLSYDKLMCRIKKNTSAMLFHSKQTRNPLRLQIIFKNIEIAYKSELRFLGIYSTENIERHD
jgi:hypothetical protein